MVQGYINPSYRIVGVVYAPPGSASYVQYTNTTMMGTSTSTQGSFATNESSSIQVCETLSGASIPLIKDNAKLCESYSNSFTQQTSNSSSIAINQTTTFVNKWPGSSDGLDHGNDIVYVWLNPIAWFSFPSTNPPQQTPIQFNGYSFDGADDYDNGSEMEVVPIYLSQLLNPSTIATSDPTLYDRLQRTWAQPNVDGTGPGLTDADLAQIAAADPFSDPNYVFSVPSAPAGNLTSSDGRFTQTVNEPLIYQPGTATATPPTYSYQWAYTNTQTQGQGATNTSVEGFAEEESVGLDFFAGFTIDLKQSQSMTWTDGWNSLTTNMTGQTNQVSVTGPAYCAPGSTTCTPYTGPQEFNVYQDNIFGTFMMYPVLSSFSVSASPASDTVAPGDSASYTLSTEANNGYTGTLTFSMMPGMPAGATGAFSANPISADGSSTLTISTSASTPPGTYPLAVMVTDGQLIYYAYFTLVVQTPNFSIAVSPGSQTITAGSSATYTVSASALNGFSGDVTLSSSNLPSGISETFSPNPIAAGASSTMTIDSTSSTAPGAYSLTVNGTSGSLSHVASPSPVIMVNAATSQTISFGTIPTQTVGTPLTLSATATSDLTVSFTSTTTGVCTVSGSTATFIAAGSCTIDANQAGDSTYAAAAMVPQSFTVNPAPLTSQTISFGAIPTQTVGTPLTLSATATSSLTVSFTSTTAGVCTVSGSTATFIAAGTCTIDANQAGNSTYAAATMVPQSFTVNPAPGTPDFSVSASPSSLSITGGESGTVTIAVTPQNGFASAVTFNCSGLPSGATCSFSPSTSHPRVLQHPTKLTVTTSARWPPCAATPARSCPEPRWRRRSASLAGRGGATCNC